MTTHKTHLEFLEKAHEDLLGASFCMGHNEREILIENTLRTLIEMVKAHEEAISTPHVCTTDRRF